MTPDELTPFGISIDPIESGRGRKYLVTTADGKSIEVPSVTTILQVCDKPGLPWWGMKVGVEGVLHLINEGLGPSGAAENPQAWVDKLTEHKLTVNHVLTQAGDRGSRVHHAFEVWCATGFLPEIPGNEDPDLGYMVALYEALDEIEHYVTVDHVEVKVASMEHGFAGRTDAIVTSEGGPHMEAGRWIVDLKTSSGIYTSHFRQLSAYQVAAKESGYGATDGGYVLWCSKDGKWKLKKSPADFEHDFLPVLGLYRSEHGTPGSIGLKGMVK